MREKHQAASSMKNIVKNVQVFNHLLKLQIKLKKEYDLHNSVAQYNDDFIEALNQSPKTTMWVRDIVLPKIHEGDEGLEEILENIETENNIVLSATKMQILLEILSSFTESLHAVQMGTLEAEYNMEENIKMFEEENMPFKTLH